MVKPMIILAKVIRSEAWVRWTVISQVSIFPTSFQFWVATLPGYFKNGPQKTIGSQLMSLISTYLLYLLL